MRRQLFLLLCACAAIAAISACNSATNPSAPSALSASGVTITGSLVAPGSGTGSTNARTQDVGAPVAVPPGLTVSVVGAGITAPVDANGQFSLRNVPAGNVELRFTAAGLTSSVTVTGLQNGQQLTITVSLPSSTTASIETERRSGGSVEDVEGRVESLPPTTAALSFMVAGRLITTDAGTQFVQGGTAASFGDLAIGQRVHVTGRPSGGSVLAAEVRIQGTNTSTGVELNGVVATFSGTPSAFQFQVGGRQVKGDAATEFVGNSTFSDLVNGARVEVKGTQRDGLVYAVRLHVETDDDEDSDFSGVIASITGVSPSLTIMVGTHTVTTTAATEVQRKGDSQTLASLKVGMTVEVDGTRQADGSIKAKKIHIEADAAGSNVEIEGTLAGRAGTCPTIAFTVSGFTVTTTAMTIFEPACASLTNGTRVEIKGTAQLGGSIVATKIEKK